MPIVAVVGALFSVSSLHGCSEPLSGPPLPVVEAAVPDGVLSIKLIDAPLDAASEIWVEFDEVSLKSCGDDGWTELDLAATTLDLLTLRDGTEAELVGPDHRD